MRRFTHARDQQALVCILRGGSCSVWHDNGHAQSELATLKSQKNKNSIYRFKTFRTYRSKNCPGGFELASQIICPSYDNCLRGRQAVDSS